MSTKSEHVQILPGYNRWLVSRTDRDGLLSAGVRETALVVLRRWLQQASPVSTRSVYALHPGNYYAIGSARPLMFDVQQKSFELEHLVVAQRVTDCRIVRTVNAREPWWLCVRFMWRAGPVRTLWPRSSVNAIGVEDDNDQALDWLLIEAAHDASKQMEDDAWHKSA